ncbi:MAG: 50S ribosomal protein L3 [Candidatus Paceibacterota bacterium]|jgi:large subunit ribosomal protein L3
MTDSKTTTENFILGLKLGMSQVFGEKGEVIPVTLVKAGPCYVLQSKNFTKDGYSAVQLGFLPKRKTTKALFGHIKKNFEKISGFRYLREFILTRPDSIKEGEVIDVKMFQKGDKLKITSISKGKGFQGVVKRHNFRGASATHGTKHALRQGGSIGATNKARVFKGMKMAGRMGGKTITIKNLPIVDINEKENILIIKGAVSGPVGSLLRINKIN